MLDHCWEIQLTDAEMERLVRILESVRDAGAVADALIEKITAPYREPKEDDHGIHHRASTDSA